MKAWIFPLLTEKLLLNLHWATRIICCSTGANSDSAAADGLVRVKLPDFAGFGLKNGFLGLNGEAIGLF
jgi:hypothetical protein